MTPKVFDHLRLRGHLDEKLFIADLVPGVNTIGSSPESDVTLVQRGVSRHHAEIRLEPERALLVDLASKNGTYKNGDQVAEASLMPGDRIGFGAVELLLEEVDSSDAELAIAINANAPAAGEERRTLTLLHSSGTGGWVELLEEFLERLTGPPRGDLVAALTHLHWILALRAAAVVERQRGRAPVVLASCGELGEPRQIQRFLETAWLEGSASSVEGASGRRPSVVTHGGHERSETGVPATVASWPAVSGEDLHLILWGEFEGRPACAPLLRLIIRLIEIHRPRATSHDTVELDEAVAGNRQTSSGLGGRLEFPAGYVVGVSPAMTALYRQIIPLADGSIPVLVVGETGVGKEWMARLLHETSARCGGPFVAVNCAAIPAELAEAELFGVAKGVATGVSERTGHFSRADAGTIFLDEIGEMPLPLQAKLLRTLQEGEVRPVGGRARPVDVRVVAATNANLEDAVAAGLFRSDLYYRLAGYVLEVPPLRDCQADIPRLVEHFLRLYSNETGKTVRGVTVKALHRLMSFSWPGNVRQLQHEVRRLVYLCADSHAIDSSLLSNAVLRSSRSLAPENGEAVEIPFEARVRELEAELIEEALKRTRGVQVQAAKLLGISRSRLARKIKELDLEEAGD